MRQRNIKNLDERIEANANYLIEDPRACRGHWREIFGNENPIYLEIGCGKGQFITAHAAREPNSNFIACEGQASVVLRALEKAEAQSMENLRIFIDYVHDLADYFEPGELAGIYLNFSDPWPKARHAKRRLTSPAFMGVYGKILAPGGTVEFKTDNRELFEYSLESIPAAGWTVKAHTFDLHHSDMAEGNVMTEYEIKFSAKGQPICKLVACRKPQP